MSIIVTVVEQKGMRPPAPASSEFHNSFTIGRAADNDFVLDDPDKFASRRHARIIVQGDTYLIEDTSAAGTNVNGNVDLRDGDRFQLETGDVIEIGDCKLQVEIVQNATPYQDVTSPNTIQHSVTEVPSFAPSQQDPSPAAAFDIDDFFGDGGSGGDSVDTGTAGTQMPTQPLDGAYYPPNQAEAGNDFGDIDDIFSEFGSNQPEPAPVPEQQAAPQQPQGDPNARGVIPRNPQTKAALDGNQDTMALRAFLQELGLDPSQLIGQNKVEVMRVAGVVMRTLTEGMMGVLSARDSVKMQFEMDDRTVIGRTRNNPLKFSGSPQEAMAKMLTQEEGYMDPVSSANEAVADAKAHQVAMISGLNSTIDATISIFDPKNLQKEFNVGFAFSKNSKYWDLYVEKFNSIAKSARNETDNVFTNSFKMQYEKQVRKFSR